jgi:WXG100 family type VII secretion target
MTQAWHFTKIAEDGASVQAVISRIANVIDDLDQSKKRLDVDWEGTASESRGIAQARWSAKTEKAKTALQEMQRTLMEANDSMQSTEQNVASMFG